MHNPDFIPEKDRTFLTWIINFLKQLNGMLSRIGFPGNEYQTLSSQSNDFSAKLTMAEEPVSRTRVTVKNKNDARNLLEKTVRRKIKEYINFNSTVTDGDREALGLPVYKTTRTRSPIATEAPGVEVDTSVIRRLTIRFFRHGGSHNRANPPGQIGVEIRHAILDHPPASVDELIHSSFDTCTPFILDYDESQRGKVVYICLRWENTRGEKGPWSEIIAVVIP